MDVKNCAVSNGGRLFIASVLNRSHKPVTSFSLMAATTGRIVIGNGENIVNYEVPRAIASNRWTRISVNNRYRVRSFSNCTVSHVTFDDGTFWTMPTPEF